MPSDAEHQEIKDRAAERLLSLPGVVAVGIGSKEVAGQPTHERSLKIFVEVKRPSEEVPADERIPAEIEGVPTDVIESGPIHPAVDPPGALEPDDLSNGDERRYRPLVGGSCLAAHPETPGTLGCFLTDDADPKKVYALTNQHVVQPEGYPAVVVGTTTLGQPSGVGSITACCSDLIGKFAGGGLSEDRDEALVQLDPGMQWTADILEVGAVAGSAVVTQADATAHNYKVRKRGKRTGLTGGVVTAVEATTKQADNVVVVTPNQNPKAVAGQVVFFLYEGDSGSMLVNDNNEVVALLDSRSKAGLGFGFAFQHVLERFASVENVKASLATAASAGVIQTVPGTAMVATPPELVGALGTPGRSAPDLRPLPPAPPSGWIPEPAGLGMAPAHLERDLDRSPTGRMIITLWLQHQAELLELVNRNRRVTVAWHRSGASALFQALARMPTDPDLALPATIHGQPLAMCLDRMQAVLGRAASPRLVRDLARVRRALPDLAERTYPQIIESLGTG